MAKNQWIQFLRWGFQAGIPFGLFMGVFLGLVSGWWLGVTWGILSGIFFACGFAVWGIVMQHLNEERKSVKSDGV